jgi:hypothetical protein
MIRLLLRTSAAKNRRPKVAPLEPRTDLHGIAALREGSPLLLRQAVGSLLSPWNLHLFLCDAGVGFDLKNLKTMEGPGIPSMAERARLLGDVSSFGPKRESVRSSKSGCRCNQNHHH